MMQPYVNQVELLLRCLPTLENESCFAIKGGTGLNLFLLNMPRLSVDIDLTYLPLAPRVESLAAMAQALCRVAADIERTLPAARVQIVSPHGSEAVSRLLVERANARIKIEPNFVLRGSVLPPASMDVCDAAQQQFQLHASALVLSRCDLYAGKICAALDRQHPRDLFDVKVLLDSTGVDDQLRAAFVVYLASHNRPFHEVLAPTPVDLAPAYSSTFAGMMVAPPSVFELAKTRSRLIELLHGALTNNERQFLLHLARGEPQWELLGFDNLGELPALQWKLQNIQRMDDAKRAAAVAALAKVLGS